MSHAGRLTLPAVFDFELPGQRASPAACQCEPSWLDAFERGREAPAAQESLTRLAGRLREVLLGGDCLGVAELEGGHEGGMHLRGGDDGALELLVARGAGVMHDDAPVAEVAGGARPRV